MVKKVLMCFIYTFLCVSIHPCYAGCNFSKPSAENDKHEKKSIPQKKPKKQRQSPFSSSSASGSEDESSSSSSSIPEKPILSYVITHGTLTITTPSTLPDLRTTMDDTSNKTLIVPLLCRIYFFMDAAQVEDLDFKTLLGDENARSKSENSLTDKFGRVCGVIKQKGEQSQCIPKAQSCIGFLEDIVGQAKARLPQQGGKLPFKFSTNPDLTAWRVLIKAEGHAPAIFIKVP